MRERTILHQITFYTFVFISGAPLIALVIFAFSEAWPYPRLIPEAYTLKHLMDAFGSHRQAWGALAQSIFIAFSVTFITLVIAIPAAKALGVYAFKGKEWIKVVVLLPIIVPTITITMGIHTTMIKLGLTGTFIGVILVHTLFTLPYAVRLLTNVFEIIGEYYEQQAWMLGSKKLFAFRKITLPLIMPGILSASMISFIVSFSQYITTFLIGGGKIMTIPLVMVPYVQSGETEVSAAYSLLFILSAVTSLIFMECLIRRYYRGMQVFYV